MAKVRFSIIEICISQILKFYSFFFFLFVALGFGIFILIQSRWGWFRPSRCDKLGTDGKSTGEILAKYNGEWKEGKRHGNGAMSVF